MSLLILDILFDFMTKDDTESDKEQLKTSRYFEGKGGIPNSRWRISSEMITEELWRLNVDLENYSTFKTANIIARGKVNVRFYFENSSDFVPFNSGQVLEQFDLAGTPLNALTSERVWCIENIRMDRDRRYKVDVNITLFGNTQSVAKMQAYFTDLLKSELHSDFVLVSSEGEEFKAHKVILCGTSDVFQKMIETDMKEKNENRVEIEDVKSGVLQKMLMFMYGGKLVEIADVEQKFLEELFTAADKYAVHDLKKAVAKEMCCGITVDNVGRRFILADRFIEEELRVKCFNFMKDNWVEVSGHGKKSILF